MINQLLNNATSEQLKDFSAKIMEMLKKSNDSLYESLEIYFYKEIYGNHFSEWLLKKALKDMKNEDDSTGGHWSVEQTTNYAKANGVAFNKYNEYDWNYVMNMIYSDYYGAINNDISSYFKLAKKFIDDKDAREGKAFKYYIAMMGTTSN